MALLQGKTPAERNKLIIAVVLGSLALFVLVRMFWSSPSAPARSRTSPTTNAQRTSTAPNTSPNLTPTPNEELVILQPVEWPVARPSTPEAGRNIFAYYVAPVPSPTVAVTPLPSPSPTPTPNLMLSGLSPVNVYARTGEFTLEVVGDRFTAETRIEIDGNALPTRFISAQRIATTVPANLIASPGGRQIITRTPDGQLFSNSATLNIMPPPTPQVTYIGLLSSRSDVAVFREQNGELINARRGETVGGRFRITNITQGAVELADTQLNIRHTLPFVESSASDGRNPNQRSTPTPIINDEEP